MAGTKRHIDQVLKNKLGNHQAPISEADWDAFDAFQQKRKPKRKAFFYWGAAILFVGLLSAVLLWNTSPEGNTPVVSNTPSNPSIQNNQNGTDLNNPESEAIESPENLPAQTETEGLTPSENGTNTISDETTAAPNEVSQEPKRTVRQSDIKNTEQGEQALPQESPTSPELHKNTSELAPVQRFEPLIITRISPNVLLIPTPSWGWFEPDNSIAYVPKEDQDSTVNPLKLAKKLPPMGPCIAVGFVYGFGTPQLSVPQSDPSQVHKDYEATQKATSAKTNVFRFFSQYEHRLNLGLEFAAGLQYSSITQVRSYNFENRNIPYIGPNGEIRYYFPLPSGQSVDPTVFISSQNIRSVSVPLSIGYSYNLSSKLRLGVRAQGNLGLNWSKSYSTLDPKTLTEMGSDGNSNPFNASYGGGVYGEYFYLSKWSLRGSFDWTAQNKQYKSGNSYNLQNRFYELRLSLVRYL